LVGWLVGWCVRCHNNYRTVSSKQYVGEPITCWVPAHFSSAHEDYANSFCWIRNTYHVPFADQIPARHPDRYRRMIPYYQWVPMILLVQASDSDITTE